MSQRSILSRLCNASVLSAAFCLGAALLAPAPAAAQYATEPTPWYMPQPWMVPQSTAPRGMSRPGQYGHAKHSRASYGSFGRSCYGSCGGISGTIVAHSGVVLFRPVVIILDPRAFQIVRRTNFAVQQPGFVIRQGHFIQGNTIQRQKAIAALPQDFVKRHPSLQNGLKQFRVSTPMIAHQNGVRLIRPNTMH